MNQKITYLILLSIAGGVITALAWFPGCTGLVTLFSLVPFFILAEITEPNDKKFGNRLLFIRILPGFLAFNIVALAWIRIAGYPLLVTAVAGNSFIMAFTFWLAWTVLQKAGKILGNISYIILWLAMEYATNNLAILSPWLNMGNSLAKNTSLIQWYEYTGVAGGTAWILSVNMMTAGLIMSISARVKRSIIIRNSIITLFLVFIPPALSLLVTKSTDFQTSNDKPSEVLVIQPCIDPYTDKFSTPFISQLDEIILTARANATENTSWIVTPETVIDDPINLGEMESDIYVNRIRELLAGYPNAVFILGATTYTPGTDTTLHNSAIMIDAGGPVAYYHKSKLVPGIEKSFSGLFAFMQHLFPYLGGTGAGYTGQKSPTLLENPADGSSAAPVICFESAFGGHVSQFVREGAGIIIIITNDGWWKNTYGYYQHLTLSSIRAIESRRPVVRAANTGISAIISPTGVITSQLPWWEPGTIKASVQPGKKITFYVRYGDMAGRVASTMALFILLIHIVAIPFRKRFSQKKSATDAT